MRSNSPGPADPAEVSNSTAPAHPTLKPLALLCCSNSLLGGQLACRLQDMGYRVQTIDDPAALQEQCESNKPLVLLAEVSDHPGACDEIALVRKSSATSHIPVLAFSVSHDKALQDAAMKAGVSLLAGNAAILEQLPQLLDQVLQL
jgi:PleD family two-component response regulator